MKFLKALLVFNKMLPLCCQADQQGIGGPSLALKGFKHNIY